MNVRETFVGSLWLRGYTMAVGTQDCGSGGDYHRQIPGGSDVAFMCFRMLRHRRTMSLCLDVLFSTTAFSLLWEVSV